MEARGYSLMLLLGMIATNQLPREVVAESASAVRPGWWMGYAVTMTLVILYDTPGGAVDSGACGCGVCQQADFLCCLDQGCGTCRDAFDPALSADVPGLAKLLSQPIFDDDGLPAVLKCVAAVCDVRHQRCEWPRRSSGALPVIIIVIGSVLGWQRAALRPMLITFAMATLLGVLLPAVIPAATEVRFVPWILPWFCIAVVSAFLSDRPRWGKIIGFLGLFTLMVWQLMQDLTLLPQQQIREGIQRIDKITPARRRPYGVVSGGARGSRFYTGTRHIGCCRRRIAGR